MTEYMAKKLGEVLAFAEVGQETLSKSRTALNTAIDHDEVDRLIEAQNDFSEQIKILTQDEKVVGITLDKAAVTAEKIRQMRDLYIKENWSNPVEVLEWLGFHTGAAGVHWSLLIGLAHENKDGEALKLAERGYKFYRGFLDEIGKHIARAGQ
jgi:hypothetical protein